MEEIKNIDLDLKALIYYDGKIKDYLDKKIPKDVMVGITTTDGMSGLVPAPAFGEQNKFLKSDGTWSCVDKLDESSFTTITIDSSDWEENSEGGYLCTKELSTPMIYTNFNFDVVLSTDQSAAKLQIEAWNCVIADGNIGQTVNLKTLSGIPSGSYSYSYTTAFTFYAFTTKPSVALTIGIQGVS